MAGLTGAAAVSLESVTLKLTYYAGATASGSPLAGAPTSVGTYTVVAAFPGSTDYGPAKAALTFAIAKATPKVAVRDAGGTYNTKPFPATATVAGVTGTAASTLEGVSPKLTYYAGATASGTPLAGAPVGAGTYTVVAVFPGSADYAAAMASATFTIARATPKVTVKDAGGTYNGKPFPVTATIAGVNGDAASSLEGVSPALTYYAGATASGTPLAGAPVGAGTYTAVAAFPGSTDYQRALARVTFTIAQHLTTAAVASSSPTTAPGQAVTFTATILGGLPSPYLPTGSVQFQLNGHDVGPPVPLGAGGTAAYVTTAPAAGSYALTAVYSGDAHFIGSSSAPATQVILAPGVYAVGTTLYVVGANTADYAEISPAGRKTDGTTGLQVNATLNNVYSSKIFNQMFTAIAIFGYDGNDNFRLASTLALPTMVVEGNGNDYIQLANGNDSVTFGTGSDQLFGGSGNKLITASDVAGTNGYIQLGNGNHSISLGAGYDFVMTGDGTDVITLGNGNDTIQLGDGKKTITAGKGNNYVHVGTGTDAVTMGNGNDTVQLGGGANTVTLAGGNDSVFAGDGNNTVTVGNGNDTLQLGNGDNVVVEGNGSDYVRAGDGANLVVGGLGQHTIQLGDGNDILIDGSVTPTQRGDTLRQVLADWKASAATAVNRRLKVTYNAAHPNYLLAGSGRDWFFYTYPKTTSNKKATDRLN